MPKRFIVKMSAKRIPKTNGETHVQRSLNVPKEFSELYPADQRFVVIQTACGELIYTPEK